MTVADEWSRLCAGLPSHGAEVMAAHQGSPSVAAQGATHGAPVPPVDLGMTDQEKYGGPGYGA